jgi:hypothetical protein
MDIVYIDMCRYEIQEQKYVPVWYTGIFRALLSTIFLQYSHSVIFRHSDAYIRYNT